MSNHRLSREERETIIVMNEAEDTMDITTWSQPMVRRVRTVAAAHEADVEDISFDGVRVTLPKKALTLRRPKQLTPEQKQKSQESLRNARKAREKQNAPVSPEGDTGGAE